MHFRCRKKRTKIVVKRGMKMMLVVTVEIMTNKWKRGEISIKSLESLFTIVVLHEMQLLPFAIS